MKWMLVGILLSAVAALYVRSAVKQRSLVQCIRHRGGQASYSRISRFPVAADWISDVLGDDYVYEVDSVVADQFKTPTDERRLLGCIAQLPDLHKLVIKDVKVDGAFLRDVGEMHSLRQLWISHAGIEDSDLAPLASLKNLESLHLDYNPIGDAGAEHIAGLPALNELNLDGTSISAQTLRVLSGPQLQYLMLSDTPITAEDLRLLKKLRLESVFVSADFGSDEEIQGLEQEISASIVRDF